MTSQTEHTPMVVHSVVFQRNRFTNMHRAMCSCGWFHAAQSLAECQLKASVHDEEWIDVPSPEKEREHV